MDKYLVRKTFKLGTKTYNIKEIVSFKEEDFKHFRLHAFRKFRFLVPLEIKSTKQMLQEAKAEKVEYEKKEEKKAEKKIAKEDKTIEKPKKAGRTKKEAK